MGLGRQACFPMNLDGQGVGQSRPVPLGDLNPGRYPVDICYQVATRTPGIKRIQEDIELGHVAYFAHPWIALGTLSTWFGTVRNQ